MPQVRNRLREESGGVCCFPGCDRGEDRESGISELQVAHIAALRNGPRWNPNLTREQVMSYDNLILLCTLHHQVVDKYPEDYPAQLLTQWKLGRKVLSSPDTPDLLTEGSGNPARTIRNPFRQACETWTKCRSDRNEEFWQQLFAETPQLLAPLLNRAAYTLNSKCYVGGKAINNSGGNVLDFLVQHRTNAACIEIKKPNESLMSRPYRNNVVLPSHELVGACLQVQTSRDSLLRHFHQLTASSSSLTAPSPTAIVLIGDLALEALDDSALYSFELFRHSFKDMIIRTYDELFVDIEHFAVVVERENAS